MLRAMFQTMSGLLRSALIETVHSSYKKMTLDGRPFPDARILLKEDVGATEVDKVGAGGHLLALLLLGLLQRVRHSCADTLGRELACNSLHR